MDLWDTNTVTHVLGVRAFGTQLLCEQVIGRALRRQSYELNEEGLFNVEYADVLGIPFDFNAKPVVAPPQKPRETIQVKAVRPERDALEIRFPRVQGYRAELPEERLTAEFNDDSTLVLTPDLVGATETRQSGIIGDTVDLTLVHTEDVRPSQVVYELTSHLVLTKYRDADGEPQLHLFGQLKRIARQWLDGHLVCKGGTYPAQLKYKMLADMACERITAGIMRTLVGSRPIAVFVMVAEQGQAAFDQLAGAVCVRLLEAAYVVIHQLGCRRVVADNDEARRNGYFFFRPQRKGLFVVAVQGLKRGLQLRWQVQRVQAFSLATTLLGHLGADVFPQIAKHRHLGTGDVVGHWHAWQFDNAAFNGVHQRKVAQSPGEQGALGITRAAQKEGRG